MIKIMENDTYPNYGIKLSLLEGLFHLEMSRRELLIHSCYLTHAFVICKTH